MESQLDVDEQAKREIKDMLISFDRSLIASGAFRVSF